MPAPRIRRDRDREKIAQAPSSESRRRGGRRNARSGSIGGLVRRMPWTSAFFLVGVLSISALPPLNGFVSEWLTLQTILRSALLASAPMKIVFAVSGALVALTAGLAVTCFAKVFAMGFLGMARSQGAEQAVEASRGARAPLALLAVACFCSGSCRPTSFRSPIARPRRSRTQALPRPSCRRSSVSPNSGRRKFRRRSSRNITISALKSETTCQAVGSSSCIAGASKIRSFSRCRPSTPFSCWPSSSG